MNYKKHKTRGFSLLELLLVVAVGAVLILAGLGAYTMVSTNNAATQGMRQLQTIKSQVQEAVPPGGIVNRATLTATLNGLRKLPPEMIMTGANTARNAFGTNTTVAGIAGQQFTVQFATVPPPACNKMARAYNVTADSDFVSLNIQGTVVDTTSVPAIATACNNAAGRTMTWTFRDK